MYIHPCSSTSPCLDKRSALPPYSRPRACSETRRSAPWDLTSSPATPPLRSSVRSIRL
ncbi:unnamed protein product [Staurois parvus]|uniref:Uncharacterized protein n=1 Tax=Staurois parvus TaxID=386267 RepID=A0ABN9GNW6_9NEOB|nr:unnamed protein product [Staurois parvus]